MRMKIYNRIFRFFNVCTSTTSPGTTFGKKMTLPSGALATETPFAPASVTVTFSKIIL